MKPKQPHDNSLAALAVGNAKAAASLKNAQSLIADYQQERRKLAANWHLEGKSFTEIAELLASDSQTGTMSRNRAWKLAQDGLKLLGREPLRKMSRGKSAGKRKAHRATSLTMNLRRRSA